MFIKEMQVKHNNSIAFSFEKGKQDVAFQIFFTKDNLRIQMKKKIVDPINLEEKNWKKEKQNWYKDLNLNSEIDVSDKETVKQVIKTAIG